MRRATAAGRWPAAALALQARAATYYVIVAGLGGEPDYEQRFTAAAKDLDKVFKASGDDCACLHADRRAGDGGAADSRRLSTVAREAKPDDDFVLILIGHGSFDGVEYKFNLVGPGHHGGRDRRAVRPHSPRGGS